MTINPQRMFQDHQITHGEAVSLISDARKEFVQKHNRPDAKATTDRATLIQAVTERLQTEHVSSTQAASAAERIVDHWLNSSSMKGPKGDDSAIAFKPSDMSFPVMEPAAVSRGAGLPAASVAEASVAKDKARTKAWSTGEIRANPSAFIRHATQLDGSGKTRTDQSACGSSALMFRIVVADPQKLTELAKLVQSKAGQVDLFARFQAFPGETPDAAKQARLDAIEHIAAGKFSAADVQALAVGLYEGFPRTDGGMGLNVLQMGVFIAKLRNAGADIPDLELQMYTPAKKGEASHWMAPSPIGLIDTWPNAKGENPLHQGDQITAGSKRLEGGVESKLFVHAGGNIISMNQYKHGDEATASDPPLAHARYDRQGNGKYTVGAFENRLKVSPETDFREFGPSGL